MLRPLTTEFRGREITPQVVTGTEFDQYAHASRFADSGDAPFPVTPERLDVAVGYRNPSYIADQVSKRKTANTQSGSYTVWTKAEGFRNPATSVSAAGKVNSVERTGADATYRCGGWGLKLFVPREWQSQNQAAGTTPYVSSVIEYLTDLIMLDRELRLAAAIFVTTPYAAANKTTKSGTSQWTDKTNATPLVDFLTGQNAIVGATPNACVMGWDAWTAFRQHPQITGSIFGVNNTGRLATVQQVMDLFELDEFYLGKAWANAVAEGATDSYARVWAHDCLIYASNPQASLLNPMPTLTFSPQWMTRIVYERNVEPGVGGLMGGTEIVVGEYVTEVVAAADAGYLIINAV